MSPLYSITSHMQIPSFTAQNSSNEIPVKNTHSLIIPEWHKKIGYHQTFKYHIQLLQIRPFLVIFGKKTWHSRDRGITECELEFPRQGITALFLIMHHLKSLIYFLFLVIVVLFYDTLSLVSICNLYDTLNLFQKYVSMTQTHSLTIFNTYLWNKCYL